MPYLTVRENVELMLDLSGGYTSAKADAVHGLLKRLGLNDRLNHLPAQLSGGQQQRVAIARALIHDPLLVLADEPTANLDTERAYSVMEILANLVHEGDRAGIVVTHDLRMCRYADKVIQMVDGRIDAVLSGAEEISALAMPA